MISEKTKKELFDNMRLQEKSWILEYVRKKTRPDDCLDIKFREKLKEKRADKKKAKR